MRREKKGVAGIIAGVFLAAILFSGVLIYFLSITQGQNTRARGEIEAQNYKNEKLQETFKIRSRDNLNAGHIEIQLNNTGAIPLTASYLLVYDGTTNLPILQGQPLIGLEPFTVNGGENTVINTGDLDGTVTFLSNPPEPYRIDIISERGNIQTTRYPPPPLVEIDLTITAPFAQSAAEAALAQQTGSIILNYTGFGAIFPNFGTSTDGVDQTGWDAKIKDVPGYPAFRLIDNQQPTYLTARVKNKDFGGQNMYLLHHTGFILTRDGGQAGALSINAVYVCATDYTTKTVSQYSDSSPITLFNEITNPPPQWRNLMFCDANIGTDPANQFKADASSGFKPTAANVNFLFMIIRGDFADGKPYAQTIPYQAALIPAGSFTASLNVHKGAAGSPVTVTTSGGTAPFDIHWIYQDGTYCLLGSIPSGTFTTVNIPPDTSDPNCSMTPVPSKFYIIQISDANERVYYRTFQLT